MSDKIIPFHEALERAAVIVSEKRIHTVDDERFLPYELGKVAHLARWIISLEVVNTPKGKRLFVIQQIPKGDDGMQWIGIPVNAQPPAQHLMTETELNEVRQLVETIYRRKP